MNKISTYCDRCRIICHRCAYVLPILVGGALNYVSDPHWTMVGSARYWLEQQCYWSTAIVYEFFLGHPI